MASRDCTVDDQQVAVIDAFFHHAVTTGSHIEGGRGVGDAVLVEVDSLLYIVLSWGRESACSRGKKQRELGNRCIGVVADHG
ncbi:hypothetical protein D3C81_2122130 [compost metagenome]